MCPRGPSIHHSISEDTIVEAGFLAVESALKTIEESADDPSALELNWSIKLGKYLLNVDREAQKAAEQTLKQQFHDKIEIRGEESSLEPFTFKSELAALLDMVDGTDLLERGLGNWCSAMTIFNEERVWASLIGMQNREIYFERHSEPQAFVREPRTPETDPAIHVVTVANKTNLKLRDASLAFYGQKSKSLLRTARHKGFLKALDRITREAKRKEKRSDAPRFRIYNLAGNPMMMKLIEGKIDAIIELSGQKCHDIIPGFSVALKAGAVVLNLETSQKITTADLPAMLACPDSSYRYVMACNEPLAREILKATTMNT